MSLIRSVSGVRGVVVPGPGERVTLTTQVARDLGRAFATRLRRTEQPGLPLLVAGRDGRFGGDVLLAAFADGARASGLNVVDLGIVTTPGMAMMVRANNAVGGVVITASHNPAKWNGIKLLTHEGFAPSKAEAEAVFKTADDGDFLDANSVPDVRALNVGPHEHHTAAVVELLDVQRIKGRSFSVVLDSVNGAGAAVGRLLLERLGCRVVHMNAEPAKTFAHTPEPVEQNLGEVCAAVAAGHVDIGFAQDPDADRLVVIDEKGWFIGEELTLALCAQRVFATRPGPAAVNLSTSRLIDDIAAGFGAQCRVHRTPVGEANVVEGMRAHDCVIGGEGNGGVIDPRVVYVRDSIVAMGLILDLMAAEQAPIGEIAGRLHSYAMIKDKLACDASRIAPVLSAARRAFGGGPEGAGGVVNEADGVRVDWPDERKWLHLRGSNTEPIMRVIVEAADAEAANGLMARARELLRSVA